MATNSDPAYLECEEDAECIFATAKDNYWVDIYSEEDEEYQDLLTLVGVDDLNEVDEVLRKNFRYIFVFGDGADRMVIAFNQEQLVRDVELEKGNYSQGDTLRWVYAGTEHMCTGEYFVDRQGRLHHTFTPEWADADFEIEISIKY